MKPIHFMARRDVALRSWWISAPSHNFTAICKAQAPRMSASPQASHVAGLPEHVGQYARPAKTDVTPIRGWVQ